MYQITIKINNQVHNIEMDLSELEDYGSIKALTHNYIYWFMRMEGFYRDTVQSYYVTDSSGNKIEL